MVDNALPLRRNNMFDVYSLPFIPADRVYNYNNKDMLNDWTGPPWNPNCVNYIARTQKKQLNKAVDTYDNSASVLS